MIKTGPWCGSRELQIHLVAAHWSEVTSPELLTEEADIWGLYTNSLVWKSGQSMTHLFTNPSRANETQLGLSGTCELGHKHQHLRPGRSNQSDGTTDLTAARPWCWHLSVPPLAAVGVSLRGGTARQWDMPLHLTVISWVGWPRTIFLVSVVLRLGTACLTCKDGPYVPSTHCVLLLLFPLLPGDCRWLPADIGDHTAFPTQGLRG